MTLKQTDHSIPRISLSQLSHKTFVDRFQRQGFPVIVSDLVNTNLDWDLDYLCQELDSYEFLLRYYGSDRYKQDKREWTSIGSGVQIKRLPFRDYAKLLRNHEAHEHDIYLAKCPLTNTPLAEEQTLQDIAQKLKQLGFIKPASAPNLWIGPGGHIECLHYDPTDGVLIQLHGTKRLILFPPSQTANLYPYPIHTHLRYGLKLRCWFSQVYPDTPNLEVFPRFRNALSHKYEILLNPGEALYIPAGWWHEVTALGNEMVCSVNQFWGVYPIRRSITTWNRWRAFLGSFCAIPYTLLSLLVAVCKGRGREKIKEITQML
ncbi:MULTISPECIES: cupin-like domain-containing protein [unclassified Leptolyngbya]|uniref:cupin-like domain-containing protein n=1 Tax=unclassified Leptolyngbya TaxID=2650499 RepID=UPI0016868D83|nr:MULTISPECIES: cupin-like domain-containing protein [unclassified Leptolyngbya]MBD1912837.1 cupin-like domain-containing protein [Leptolyngbya sp. FACHB-8]MBD2153113.1 cupin-like domain-containing protein [Leptolyngbya sp. FACHB-16]